MAENKTGIGGLYSSGYGPYMTRTDAQFVRRPAQNFMTGQNLQNPPLDIFDVTMNPDQFFGGSGTGTFNQQFEGSVRRPGLGSGNPNLGDPTFGGGTVPGGGGAGNTGGGGSGGSGGGSGGGGGDGGVIIGPGPGGGGGVDLELPVVKGPGTGEQILGLLVGAGVSAGMTKLIDKLSKGEEITPADTEDLTIEEQTKINEALNQTGYDMSANLTDIIDSKVDPIIENNIETKFEEDLYDNLEPDEGLVTDVDGNVIGGSDFTDLDGLITGKGEFYVTDRFEEGDPDQIKKLQELRDAGFDVSTSFDILDSIALGSISLEEYEALVGGGTGKVTIIENPTSEEIMTKTSGDDIFTTDDNSVFDETSGQYGTINSAGDFIPALTSGATGLINAVSTGSNVGNLVSVVDPNTGGRLFTSAGSEFVPFSGIDPDIYAGGFEGMAPKGFYIEGDELITDGGGNIFNKFGEFMGNKDALGIGVSPGQVLGGISGALSLADFIDDPSFSSGLGTLAGAGAAFFPGAAANPYLAGAALVAGLLEAQQEPSNETGIANLDLGSGKVISYGMGGDKQNDQNVATADTIATAMTPIANDIAETYGITFEGDIEVGIGNRDNMYVSIGNQEEDSTYMDRLTYNPEEGDLNLMTGAEGQVLTYRYEPQSGEQIVEDLTKNLTLAAQKAVANGETVVNLTDAVAAAPSGKALEQKFSNLGLEDYAIDALTRSAKGMGGSSGILPQFNVSYDDRQYLTPDEEMVLIEMGLLDPEDAAFVREADIDTAQKIDSYHLDLINEDQPLYV